jgi:hypothetical protein
MVLSKDFLWFFMGFYKDFLSDWMGFIADFRGFNGMPEETINW